MIRCKKCWCPQELGHNDGCPEMGGNLEEYDNGYTQGFQGEHIRWHTLVKYYSKSFQLGFKKGERAIEEAVNCALEKM